jgi:hypothetical protein
VQKERKTIIFWLALPFENARNFLKKGEVELLIKCDYVSFSTFE